MFSRLLAVVVIGFNCGFIAASSSSCDDMSNVIASVEGLLEASRRHKESIIEAKEQLCSSISSVEASFTQSQKNYLEDTKKRMIKSIEEVELSVFKFDVEVIASKIASKYGVGTLFDRRDKAPEPCRTKRLLELDMEMDTLPLEIQKALFSRYMEHFARRYDREQYDATSPVSQIMNKYIERLKDYKLRN